MSLDLVIQEAIRAQLIANAAVTALVPANNIADRHSRPVSDPAIIIGEGQSLDEGDIARRTQRHFATLHVWKKEPSFEGVKAITGAIRSAIRASRPALDPGFHLGDWHVRDIRYLRDPDGEASHGIVTVECVGGEP